MKSLDAATLNMTTLNKEIFELRIQITNQIDKIARLSKSDIPCNNEGWGVSSSVVENDGMIMS